MDIGVYDSAELTEVIKLGRSFKPFLADALFGRTSIQQAEFLSFDEYTDNNSIMPLVNPLLPTAVSKVEGYTTKSFTPAYFSAMNSVEFSEVAQRGKGEPFGSSQDYETKLAMRGIEQQRKLDRTKDYLASQVLRTGAMTIVGQDGSSYSLDFLRDASLTETLLTTDRWGETGVSPVADLENFCLLLDKPCKKIVLGSAAWKYLREDPTFLRVIDTQNRTPTKSSIEIGPQARPYHKHL